MPSPFPGMDPYLEGGEIFQELHTQFLAEAQGLLQPQLRPKYVAKLELDEDALPFRRQRRIVIYLEARPRVAVASVELLSPSNKAAGLTGQARYLARRASALDSGLHWVEIDLLRGGQRPPLGVELPRQVDYLVYVAQVTAARWNHLVYGWGLRDPLPLLPIPLLGPDQVSLDLGACWRQAYDSTAAHTEANYAGPPCPPPLRSDDLAWAEALLGQHRLR